MSFVRMLLSCNTFHRIELGEKKVSIVLEVVEQQNLMKAIIVRTRILNFILINVLVFIDHFQLLLKMKKKNSRSI